MQKNPQDERIFILVLFRSCDGGAFRDVEPSADLYYSLLLLASLARTLALAITPNFMLRTFVQMKTTTTLF